jgi:uncharacterized protein
VGQPVVHFKIIGRDPTKLRSYYGDLFGGSSTPATRPPKRSPSPATTGSWTGTPPATGSTVVSAVAKGYEGRVLFYVSVPNVEAALKKAESFGGKRRMGPEGTPAPS